MTKLYKKQILRMGRWLHPNAPNGVLEITKDYLNKVVNNFSHSPFVPVTRGHAEQQKVDENPELIVAKNIKSLEVGEDGLYADVELDPKELDKYNDVSVSVEPNYVNHETGAVIGPMLKHVALVTNPFIKGLNPFVELKDTKTLQIYLSDIRAMEDTIQDETIADSVVTEPVVVEAPKEIIEPTEEVAKEQEEESQAPVEPESAPPASPAEEEVRVPSEPVDASEDLKRKIAELSELVVSQQKQLVLNDAEATYQSALKEGKVVPAQKEAFIQLASATGSHINLADGETKTIGEVLKDFLASAPKVIDFTERGVDVETGEAKFALKSAHMSELKQQFPDKTDVQIMEYVQKNSEIFAQYLK